MSEHSNIQFLFEPRSVAIIGASASEDKIGYKIQRNIMDGGYRGTIYPINPKGGDILGVPSYPSILDIEGDVDLATIVIPAKYVVRAVEECAQKKVKFLSIITSGFSEVGNWAEEHKIVELAHANGMRVLGPNIFGIYSAETSLNATFGPADIKRGGVAIITQSGALGIAMIGKTKIENIGLSAIVSVGNKSDLDEADLLQYLNRDESTKVILMYIEGVKNGERLVEALKRVTKKKPVIAIKSGRSKRGAMAAASHTGSLAGADEIFDAVMKQCGVARAETIEEALNWCKFLSTSPAPKGENAVIITNGGGIGVLAADACEKYGVNLADDPETMKEIFDEVTPDFGSIKNPVDITGQAMAQDYEICLEAAFKHPAVDSIICLGCETAVLDVERLTESLEKVHREHGASKPAVLSFFGGQDTENSIVHLRSRSVPIFLDVYDAVSCLGANYRNYRNLKDAQAKVEDVFDPRVVDIERIKGVIAKVRAAGRTFLLAPEAQEVMVAAKMPMPQSKLARNLDEAVQFAEAIGYPVVMKIVSKDIIHKSDAGGVALDLLNKGEVMDAYEAIMHNARAYDPAAVIDGVEVVEMVKSGTETIIGARRDESFGPVVMFGLGGIYVEVMKDIAFRALPLNRAEAMEMIKDIRSYPLLLGVRGEARKDIEGVIECILKVGTILQYCEDITDIEVNPLVAYDQGDGVRAVDVRILLSKSAKGDHHG